MGLVGVGGYEVVDEGEGVLCGVVEGGFVVLVGDEDEGGGIFVMGYG